MNNTKDSEKVFTPPTHSPQKPGNQIDQIYGVAAPEREYLRVWSLNSSEPKALKIKKGGFAIRSIAYFIDRIILGFIDLLFFTVGLFAIKTGSYFQTGIPSFENLTAIILPTYIVILLAEIAYYTYFHGHTGQTIGKMLCGLKVVNIQGEVIGYRRAFLRWMGYVISSLILYLGFFWIAIDRNRQGWHDKIAKTYVIKV
jgi:uncharacterized RDD family membrane protein YckC